VRKTLAGLAVAVAVLSASGCIWPYHAGRHGGRGRGGDDDRQGAQRPDPPSRSRGRPAPPSWGH
jgi:hypothetical protein